MNYPDESEHSLCLQPDLEFSCIASQFATLNTRSKAQGPNQFDSKSS